MPLQAPGKDGGEGDLDEGEEVLLRPLDEHVQSAVAADPAERALHDPSDFGGEEYPVATAGDRPDHDAEGRGGFGQALAAIAEMEATYEESRTHLGIETQRQWAGPAVFRTAPLLFGLYSLITLYVHQNAAR